MRLGLGLGRSGKIVVGRDDDRISHCNPDTQRLSLLPFPLHSLSYASLSPAPSAAADCEPCVPISGADIVLASSLSQQAHGLSLLSSFQEGSERAREAIGKRPRSGCCWLRAVCCVCFVVTCITTSCMFTAEFSASPAGRECRSATASAKTRLSTSSPRRRMRSCGLCGLCGLCGPCGDGRPPLFS